MKRRPRSVARSERGQVLILFVGIVTVFLVMAAVVVDLSLWLAERRDAQKAADLSAAAGALDLPVGTTSGAPAAMTAACGIAGANGYGTGNVDGQCGTSGSAVTVEFLCTNHLASPPSGICHNTGSGATVCPPPAAGCDGVRVTVRREGPVLFSSMFRDTASDVAISSGAAAGLTIDNLVLDSVVLLEAARGMTTSACVPGAHTPCPMRPGAVAAANGFIDVLASSTNSKSKVGMAAYNFCFNPPFTNEQCITPSHVLDLTNDATALHHTANSNIAWGGANICVGLLKAQEMFHSPNAQTDPRVRKSVLLLSSGDNNFFYGGSTTYPPDQCRASSDATQPSACPGALPGEREMDSKTLALAQSLKVEKVDIYVVAFAPCGADDGQTQSTSYCAGVGNNEGDNVANQRLLKCVASSPRHYFRVMDELDLPNVFRQVAGTILGRRLLQ